MKVASSIHKLYATRYQEWVKWRLSFKGGRDFIDEYLREVSDRETDADFRIRKAITYSPAFASAAIRDVSNSIFHRAQDITRLEGDNTYRESVLGRNGGVNYDGHSMNSFIGQQVLPELLSMGEVGVFVDMPDAQGQTLADDLGRPYIYIFEVENIRNYAKDRFGRFDVLLLRTTEPTMKDGLPDGFEERFLLFRRANGGVLVEEYDNKNVLISRKTLNIAEIPFVHLRISHSLMTNVADYQISLLNVCSSDLSIVKANFPFLVVPSDPRARTKHAKTTEDTTEVDGNEIQIGPMFGFNYPLTSNPPSFIHPPAEPLRASMEKQQRMKDEIRELVSLAVTQLQPRMASAESKDRDNQGLEAGLSYIGLELEYGENQIAKYWAQFVGGDSATVIYPRKYQIKSDSERRKDNEHMMDLQGHVPSVTFQRLIAKRLVTNLLGDKITSDEAGKIAAEIEAAGVVLFDPEKLLDQIENGVVSPETASKLLGYDDTEWEKAEAAHTRRLARVAAAQSSQARGLEGDPQDGKREKELSRNTDQKGVAGDQTRGEGK